MDPKPQDKPHRHNIADDVDPADDERADAGGSTDESAGMPGGTLGTGGAREEDM